MDLEFYPVDRLQVDDFDWQFLDYFGRQSDSWTHPECSLWILNKDGLNVFSDLVVVFKFSPLLFRILGLRVKFARFDIKVFRNMVFILQTKDDVLDHRFRISDDSKFLVIYHNSNSRVKMQKNILTRIKHQFLVIIVLKDGIIAMRTELIYISFETFWAHEVLFLANKNRQSSVAIELWVAWVAHVVTILLEEILTNLSFYLLYILITGHFNRLVFLNYENHS